jgi:hypothetical protein
VAQIPQLTIDAAQVLQMLQGQQVTGRGNRVSGMHGREEPLGPIRRDFLSDSAGNQLGQQRVQPTRRRSARTSQLLVALRQQPQHGRMISTLHDPQTRRPHRRDGNRIPIVRVVLVRPARPQHPHTSRQRRGNIDNAFTDPDELLT